MRFNLLILFGFIGVYVPGVALACACCSEPGERFEYQIEFGRYELEQISRLQPKGPARVFINACGLDCFKGVSDPQDGYGVEMAVSEAGVDFDLSDSAGAYRGTIGVDFPAGYTLYGVDTDPNAHTTTTVLFSEMRMSGFVTGTGDFTALTGAEGEVILSGFGNSCLNVVEMQNWSLSAAGEGVGIRLFGALRE